MSTRVVRNIGWNTAFLGTQILAALAVVPLLLKSSGDLWFGVYSFFLAVVGASALVQAGIDMAMARCVARFKGDLDRARLDADLSFGYVFCFCAGVLQATVVLILTHVPGLIDAQAAPVANKLSIVFAVSAVLNAPLFVAQGIMVGLQRFLGQNLITTVPSLVGLVVAVGLSTRGASANTIVVYAGAVELTRFLAGLGGLARASALLPHLGTLTRRGIYRKEIIGFQLKQVGNQVADYFFYASDRLILQATVGAVIVAHYAVADRPNNLAQSVISTPLIAIVPSLATAAASGDHDYIQKVLTAGTRLYCWLTLPVLIALFVSAPYLIHVWVGAGYGDSARAAQVFVICLVVAAPFKIYSHSRLAEGSIGVMTVSKLAFAPVNAGVSFLLSERIGLMGVVIPTAVFYAGVYPVVWIMSMLRRGELTGFARVSSRPALAILATLAVTSSTEHFLGGFGFIRTAGVTVLDTLLGLILFATLGGGWGSRRMGGPVAAPAGDQADHPVKSVTNEATIVAVEEDLAVLGVRLESAQ